MFHNERWGINGLSHPNNTKQGDKKMENINYDLIGSIFMAVMFTNLIWNIQKKIDK